MTDEDAARDYAGKMRLAFQMSTDAKEAAEAGYLAGLAAERERAKVANCRAPDEVRAIIREAVEEGRRTGHLSRMPGEADLIADEYAARLAAVAGPVDGQRAWQPIETAPRDGSWFVIFTHGIYEVGRHDPSHYDSYVEAENGLFRKEQRIGYEWEGFSNFHAATHWFPLPPCQSNDSDN